jgi:hypothetical protein
VNLEQESGAETIRYFFTAAHCFDDWIGKGTGTGKFYQHTKDEFDINLIGQWFYDPEPSSDSCSGSPSPCRYSDAMAVLLGSGVDWEFGRIAQTTGFGSITISSNDPHFNIIGGDPPLGGDAAQGPITGLEAWKVGPETGWTRGEVTASCLERYTAGIWLSCQARVEGEWGIAEDGESGAPVFRLPISPTSPDDVIFLGILWGGTEPWLYWFSHVWGLEQDFGSFEIRYGADGGGGTPPGNPGNCPYGYCGDGSCCDSSGMCDDHSFCQM